MLTRWVGQTVSRQEPCQQVQGARLPHRRWGAWGEQGSHLCLSLQLSALAFFPSCQLREDFASQVASMWKVLIFLSLNSLNHHPTSLARWRRCLIWPHLCPLAGTPCPHSLLYLNLSLSVRSFWSFWNCWILLIQKQTRNNTKPFLSSHISFPFLPSPPDFPTVA